MSSSCSISAMPTTQLLTGEPVSDGSDRPVTTRKEADKRGGWVAYTQVGMLPQVSTCSALLHCFSQHLQHLLIWCGQLGSFFVMNFIKLRIAASSSTEMWDCEVLH